jgi:hypothetical protein
LLSLTLAVEVFLLSMDENDNFAKIFKEH